MTRRSKWWPLAAGLYFAVNLFGAVYAIAMGEVPHAALHVVLLLVGAAVWSRLGPTSNRAAALPASDLADRFRNLEQSIDAVAIEVERIGEGQRHMTNLLVDREGTPVHHAQEPADVDRDRSSS
jgi:hypothetical protein